MEHENVVENRKANIMSNSKDEDELDFNNLEL